MSALAAIEREVLRGLGLDPTHLAGLLEDFSAEACPDAFRALLLAPISAA